MADKAELERLFGAVEATLAALPAPQPHGNHEDYQQRLADIRAYHQAAEDALAILTTAEGGKFKETGSNVTLRLGGFTASCTAGAAGVLQNWLAGAKRRLAKLEAA